MHNAKLIIGGIEINLSVDRAENVKPHITRDFLIAIQDALQGVVNEYVPSTPLPVTIEPPQHEESKKKVVRLPRAEWTPLLKP